jgi:hypothetical protein
VNLSAEGGRLSRSGTSRSSEPDRRPAPHPELRRADLVWELWNLRALFPAADPAHLRQILQRRQQGLAREREALVGLWAGEQGILSPGRSFLAARPDLHRGITVSLHQGPYQLLPEPWLAAGCDPVVLINAGAEAEFTQVAAQMSARLRHRGKLTLLAVGPQGFLRQAVRAVRDGRPVLVYLDGNNGERGMARTRDAGLRYRLPGRDIRVRTGLARLACRLEAPVHPVALSWQQGGVTWDLGRVLQPRRQDDPLALTRQLFDWLFSQVLRQPEQWHYWAMLKESSACFASVGLNEPRVPQGLRDDFRRAFEACVERSPTTVKLCLEKEVEVWPGDVLADLSEDRFYPAAGLADSDLDCLRGGHPTLAELIARHGHAWVRFHGLRLCLLGMARLGG